MPTPSSGAIAVSNVNTELAYSSTANTSLGADMVRSLGERSTSRTLSISLSNLYNRSAANFTTAGYNNGYYYPYVRNNVGFYGQGLNYWYLNWGGGADNFNRINLAGTLQTSWNAITNLSTEYPRCYFSAGGGDYLAFSFRYYNATYAGGNTGMFYHNGVTNTAVWARRVYLDTAYQSTYTLTIRDVAHNPNGGHVYGVYEMRRTSDNRITAIVVIQHSTSDGSSIWIRGLYPLNGTCGTNDSNDVKAVADTSGNVYVTYSAFDLSSNFTGSVITKLNSSGTAVWNVTTSSSTGLGVVYGMAVDSSGNLAFAGNAPGGGARVWRFTSTGAFSWAYNISNSAAFNSVAFDSSGNLYIAGANLGNTQAIVIKFNSAGTVQWQRGITYGTSNYSTQALGITVCQNYFSIIGPWGYRPDNYTNIPCTFFGTFPNDGSRTQTISGVTFYPNNSLSTTMTYAATSFTFTSASLTLGTSVGQVGTQAGILTVGLTPTYYSWGISFKRNSVP